MENVLLLRLFLKRLLRREPIVHIGRRVPTERIGSGYGGWLVATQLLPPSPIVYSCGVGEDLTFDVAMIRRFGSQVFAFDPVDRAINYEKRVREQERVDIRLMGVAIGAVDGVMKLYPPVNTAWVSYSTIPSQDNTAHPIQVPMRSVASLMRDLRHTHLDVLKLDIEGAEYDVVDSLIAARVSVGQLLVEFHHRLLRDGVRRTEECIRELAEAGFLPFAVSASGREVSLVHRSIA